MNEPKLQDIINHLDDANELAGQIVAGGTRPDATPHDWDDLYMARLCIEQAASLLTSAMEDGDAHAV